MYVHSGRSANAEAPLTLLVTLTAVALWHAKRQPWHVAWTGPISAAVVLLKGPAALAFIAPIALVGLWRLGSMVPRLALATAALGGLAPVVAWAWGRSQVDETRFLSLLLTKDVLDRAVTPLEGHDETVFCYLEVLHRYHYEWLTGLALVTAVARPAWPGLGAMWRSADAERQHALALLSGWVVAGLVVPTVIATRIAWYLNPFYPAAAVGAGLLIDAGLRSPRAARPTVRRLVIAVLLLTVVGAEAKLAWRSLVQLDLGRSPQELLLRQAPAIRGATMFAPQCPGPEVFLVRAAGATCIEAVTAGAALGRTQAGDLWLGAVPVTHPALRLVDENRAAWLYRIEH